MRKLNPVYIVAALISLIGVVVITALLVPQHLHPAYDAAIEFVNAAASGDDATAESHLSDGLFAYLADTCPEGRVSACVDAYTPPEWGDFLNAVYRRAQPDGRNAWDILLLGTWEEGQGFSGVCIYVRAERVLTVSDDSDAEPADESWEIVRYSGFVSCDLPNAGLSGLAADDAPNRAP